MKEGAKAESGRYAGPAIAAAVKAQRSRKPPLWLLFAPVIFLLLWSGGYSAVKIGLQSAEPFFLLTLRYLLVLAVLVPAYFVLRPPIPASRTQWQHLATVGLLIQGLYFAATNFAIAVGASAAALGIILALQPILVALLAPSLTGESVSRRAWLGLVFGISGAVIAILAKSHIGDTTLAGIATAGFAVMFITAGTLYEKRFGSDHHPVVANTVQCAAGLMIALPAALAIERLTIDWTWSFVLSLLYSSLCNSIIAMTLLFAMIRHGAAARASALLFLVPPTSAAMAWYLFGEEMPVAAWIGMALAGLGVTMVRRG
jgi:drug/metabolite transporter (DMT)-like permease